MADQIETQATALQRVRDDLELQVHKRTVELTQKAENLEVEIIERKRAEEALRESESRKAAVLESALDAIVIMDHEGKIVDFNPAAEKTFGCDRAAAIGMSMAEMIMPPSYRDAHLTGLANY